MISLLRRYLPSVVWMAVIYYLSSQSNLPGASLAWVDFLFKKLGHMTVYGVLFFLLYRAVNEGQKKQNWLLPFIFTMAYAVTDELHQSLTPGRSATMRDVGYDTLGAGIVLLWKQRFI